MYWYCLPCSSQAGLPCSSSTKFRHSEKEEEAVHYIDKGLALVNGEVSFVSLLCQISSSCWPQQGQAISMQTGTYQQHVVGRYRLNFRHAGITCHSVTCQTRKVPISWIKGARLLLLACSSSTKFRPKWLHAPNRSGIYCSRGAGGGGRSGD